MFQNEWWSLNQNWWLLQNDKYLNYSSWTPQNVMSQEGSPLSSRVVLESHLTYLNKYVHRPVPVCGKDSCPVLGSPHSPRIIAVEWSVWLRKWLNLQSHVKKLHEIITRCYFIYFPPPFSEPKNNNLFFICINLGFKRLRI